MKLHNLPKRRVSQLSKEEGLELVKEHRGKILNKKKHKEGISKKPKILDAGLSEIEEEFLELTVPRGQVEKLSKTRNRKGKKAK